MSDFNIKQFHDGLKATAVPFNHDGYKLTLLKPRNNMIRVNVQHKATNKAKTVSFKPQLNKSGELFDWEPIIDGASMIGSLLAPEFAPFIHMGKHALKSWMKGKKEKKHKEKKHHEDNFERAYSGRSVERSMEPMENRFVAKPKLNKKPIGPTTEELIQRAQLLVSNAPKTANGVHMRVVNGVPTPHVTAHDGVVIPIHKYVEWRNSKSRLKHLEPLQNRRTFEHAICQPSLRQIVEAKVDPLNVEFPTKAINGRMMPQLKRDDIAKINLHSSLSASNVPLLNGEMGTEMDMAPVTVVKTENHAIIAGSELLGDLTIPAGAGVAGGIPLTQLINPRAFIGTKLGIEAQTWLMFRFRKFVLEYIPTISANVAGAFIEYFTEDPNEPTLTGLAQRRNAMEHDESVPFQPFSYIVCGLGPKKQDKMLYYMAPDDGDEERICFQSRWVLTNNAQNAEQPTVNSYGTFVIHYECDFYYPALPTGTAIGNYGTVPFTGAAQAADLRVELTAAQSNFVNVEQGWVFTAVIGSVPTGAVNCYFNVPDGGVKGPKLTIGQTYFLRVLNVGASDVVIQIFNQLNYAMAPNSNDSLGALFVGVGGLSAGTWQWGNVNRLDPYLFGMVKRSLKDIEDLGDSSSSEDELTQSEIDIIDLKRRTAKLTPLPLDSLSPKISLHAKAKDNKYV